MACRRARSAEGLRGMAKVLLEEAIISPTIKTACNVGDLGSIPGLGRSPGVGHGNPLQYSCLHNTHGQRRLAGYVGSMGLKRVGHN